MPPVMGGSTCARISSKSSTSAAAAASFIGERERESERGVFFFYSYLAAAPRKSLDKKTEVKVFDLKKKNIRARNGVLLRRFPPRINRDLRLKMPRLASPLTPIKFLRKRSRRSEKVCRIRETSSRSSDAQNRHVTTTFFFYFS